MRQTAPEPTELADLVARLRYKAGWVFTLEDVDRGQGSEGLTLCILIATPDSYAPEHTRRVMHYMIVPAASYDRQSWQRWLLDQILAVERHEACEFFRIAAKTDRVLTPELVERPYAPNHGPGRDPYTIFDYATDTDRRTSYRGELKRD